MSNSHILQWNKVFGEHIFLFPLEKQLNSTENKFSFTREEIYEISESAII